MALTVIFIITMCVDNVLPFVLALFYKGYSHKYMALSVLGSRQSPVKNVYNVWCVVSGVCFVVCGIVIAILHTNGLTIAIAVLLSIYGISCEIVSGFFPLNEKREDMDKSGKIHGVSSAIGFMCLLPVPLLIGILYFDILAVSIISMLCFALAMLFFCFFVMGDKERFRHTVFAFEGVWQRLILLCCYIPIVAFSVLM